jgi:hypothetical protein
MTLPAVILLGHSSCSCFAYLGCYYFLASWACGHALAGKAFGVSDTLVSIYLSGG